MKFDSYFLLIRLMKCLVAQVTACAFIATRVTALMRTTPFPGYSTVSGDSPEDSSISGATACMFKVKIKACKLFTKFVHSPFGTIDKIAGI